MTNLLEETRVYLIESGKIEADVRWVGSSDGAFATTWDGFAQIADVDYDSGYGAQEVVRDLVIVGDDWWMERAEYDGAEGWTFKSMPTRRADSSEPRRVVYGMWDTMERAHAKIEG